MMLMLNVKWLSLLECFWWVCQPKSVIVLQCIVFLLVCWLKQYTILPAIAHRLILLLMCIWRDKNDKNIIIFHIFIVHHRILSAQNQCDNKKPYVDNNENANSNNNTYGIITMVTPLMAYYISIMTIITMTIIMKTFKAI